MSCLLAVLANRFESIVREMTNTLLRSGRSAVLNMARDYSCSLITSENELLASAEGLPVHVTGTEFLAEAMTELHPDFADGGGGSVPRQIPANYVGGWALFERPPTARANQAVAAAQLDALAHRDPSPGRTAARSRATRAMFPEPTTMIRSSASRGLGASSGLLTPPVSLSALSSV